MKKRLIVGLLAASVLAAASAIPAQASCRGSRYCHATHAAHHVTKTHSTKLASVHSHKRPVRTASAHTAKRVHVAFGTAHKTRRYASRLRKSSASASALAIPVAGSASQANVISLIKAMAPSQGVPTWFALRIAHVESNYNPRMRGSAGEYGVYQMKCATAKDIGFHGNCAALLDPRTNVQWGLKHLALAIGKSNGNLRLAASKHNGGLGRRTLVPTYVARVF